MSFSSTKKGKGKFLLNDGESQKYQFLTVTGKHKWNISDLQPTTSSGTSMSNYCGGALERRSIRRPLGLDEYLRKELTYSPEAVFEINNDNAVLGKPLTSSDSVKLK